MKIHIDTASAEEQAKTQTKAKKQTTGQGSTSKSTASNKKPASKNAPTGAPPPTGAQPKPAQPKPAQPKPAQPKPVKPQPLPKMKKETKPPKDVAQARKRQTSVLKERQKREVNNTLKGPTRDVDAGPDFGFQTYPFM